MGKLIYLLDKLIANIGSALVFESVGLAAVPGGLLIAHGFDNFMAGGYALIHGRHRESVAVKALQATGMSHQTATSINDYTSLFGSMGGAGLFRNIQHTASWMRLPSTASHIVDPKV